MIDSVPLWMQEHFEDLRLVTEQLRKRGATHPQIALFLMSGAASHLAEDGQSIVEASSQMRHVVDGLLVGAVGVASSMGITKSGSA